MAETQTATVPANPLDAVIEQIKSKAVEDTQKLHDMAKAYKSASGTSDEVKKWIDASEDAEVVRKREAIKKALAKIAELRSELESEAKKALVPSGYDSSTVAKDFKALKTATKTLILQSKGVVNSLGVEDTSDFDELLENLPNIGGGITASGKSPAELAEARAWLKEQGEDVADKGRIAKDLLAKFDSRNDAPVAEETTAAE